MVAEFRRGIEPTTITSLTFDEESKYLICAAVDPTVHVFKVPLNCEEDAGNPKSMCSMLSRLIASAGDTWSFA